jgi:AcrR family transcriptional regulator
LTIFSLLVPLVTIGNRWPTKRTNPERRRRRFWKFGFKKTSVDDLAAAAGISKQGLYLHFSSKEEVFLAGLQKYLDDCLSRVQQELTKPGSSLLARN